MRGASLNCLKMPFFPRSSHFRWQLCVFFNCCLLFWQPLSFIEPVWSAHADRGTQIADRRSGDRLPHTVHNSGAKSKRVWKIQMYMLIPCLEYNSISRGEIYAPPYRYIHIYVYIFFYIYNFYCLPASSSYPVVLPYFKQSPKLSRD